MSIGIRLSDLDQPTAAEGGTERALEGLAALARSGTENEMVTVPIDDISDEQVLRKDGLNQEHVAVLAEIMAELPPIVIQRDTMRVIDGLHRVQAARRLGETEIAAVYFDGNDVEAHILGVKLNSEHGLPLSRRDRRMAVMRILNGQPAWSDRRIAALAGVSPKTVGSLRRSGQEIDPLQTRLGQDNRLRPVNVVEGRRRAGQAFRSRPEATVREVAKAAGISPATAGDVRRRLAQGLDPVPDALRTAEPTRRSVHSAGAVDTDGAGGSSLLGAEQTAAVPVKQAVPSIRSKRRTTATAADPNVDGSGSVAGESDEVEISKMLASLGADPSVRSSMFGRMLLQVVRAQEVITRDLNQLVRAIPAHRRSNVAGMARHCAEAWLHFARELDSQPVQQRASS